MRRCLVHNLQAGIVLEDIEHRAVSLPQEFEPWRDDSPIRSVSGLFAGHGREEDRLGGF